MEFIIALGILIVLTAFLALCCLVINKVEL